VSGTPPLPRFNHSANISGSDILFFGGWTSNSGAKAENKQSNENEVDYFVILNTDSMSWERG